MKIKLFKLLHLCGQLLQTTLKIKGTKTRHLGVNKTPSKEEAALITSGDLILLQGCNTNLIRNHQIMRVNYLILLFEQPKAMVVAKEITFSTGKMRFNKEIHHLVEEETEFIRRSDPIMDGFGRIQITGLISIMSKLLYGIVKIHLRLQTM